jgi:hypothetical protein
MIKVSRLKEIIEDEFEYVLLENYIDIPLSLVMPNFSEDPYDLEKPYCLNYKMKNPMRNIIGVEVFLKPLDDEFYEIKCQAIKPRDLKRHKIGKKQHAVFNMIKNQILKKYEQQMEKENWHIENMPGGFKKYRRCQP